MSKLGNWYSEQRKLTAFLREHKDEYYPRAKKPAIVYTLSVAVIGFLVLVGVEVSLTYGSVLLAFWSGAVIGACLLAVAWTTKLSITIAREIQTELKKKYNYTPND